MTTPEEPTLDSDEPPAPMQPGDALTLTSLAVRLNIVERSVGRLRADIGKPPDKSARPPVEGTGIRGAQAEILARLDTLSDRLDKHFDALEKGASARAAMVSRIAWIVVGALLLAGVGYLVTLAGRIRIVERTHDLACIVQRRT